MSKKGGSTKSTQTTQLPPWVEQYSRANLDLADRLTAPLLNGTPGAGVGQFNADQTNAFDLARNYAQRSSAISPQMLGYDQFQAIANAKARTLADFGGRQQVQAARAESIAPLTAASVGPAAHIGDVQNVAAQKFTDADINAYMNPYLQSVVDTSLGDLNNSYDRNLSASNMQAAAAGAFGGGRHGVRDAQVVDDYLRNVARTTAGLRSQAFDTAGGLIQSDQNRRLQADTANQQAALQRALAQSQLDQQNALQQAAYEQATREANYQNVAQTALANAANQQQAFAANASLSQQARQADFEAALRGDQQKLDALGAMSNASLAAQNAQDQRAQQNIDLLRDIGDQQQQQVQAGIDAQQKALLLRQQILSGSPYPETTTSAQKTNKGLLGNALDAVSLATQLKKLFP